MRALRRIATPASVAVAIGGCSYPFDEYLPQRPDAGPATNATATPQTPYDTGGEDTSRDSGVFETAIDASVDEVASDSPTECTCVKYAGAKCKEWSPPGCGD
jgi:hypothetical protein